MTKSKLTKIIILGFIALLISCNGKANNGENSNKSMPDTSNSQIDNSDMDSTAVPDSTVIPETPVNAKAVELVNNLKSGEKLSAFISDKWVFVYHEDNRCDGSTDGEIDNLDSARIDNVITLKVKNDGDGWGCDKKEPKEFDLDFNLLEKIKAWDRVEIANYENHEEGVVYVVGAGESDYLKLHYNENNLIVRLDYRSEDPG